MGNAIDNLSGLSGSGTVGSYISIAITALAALSLILGIAYGFKRGFSRSVVRLLTVLVSGVAAYFIASGVSGAVTSMLSDVTLPEMWNYLVSGVPELGEMMTDEMLALLGEFDPETSSHIIALIISLVCIPLIFVVVFYLLKLVTMIIYWVVSAMLGLSKRRTKLSSRFIGCAIGAVQGIVIAFIFALPIVGFSNVAAEFRTMLTSDEVSAEDRSETETFFATYVDDTINNPVVKVVNSIGGNTLFDKMTVMTFGDDKISTEDELITFLQIYMKSEHLADMDWEYPTEKHKTALNDIVDLIGDDYYTATVVSGVLRGFSRSIDDGILTINLEEPMNSFAMSIVRVFSDSSRANLGGDLDTVIHIYFILADNHVIANFYDDDALRDSLLAPHEDGKNVIDYVVDELYLNPRTAGIVDALTEISIKIMCEELNLSDDAEEVYNNVKTDVSAILTMNESDFESPEEYKEAVSTELKATLANNNITLDEKIVDSMSDFIAENYSDTAEEITDEDINKAILSYYRSYAEENPDADLPDELPDELPDNIEDIFEDIIGGGSSDEITE